MVASKSFAISIIRTCVMSVLLYACETRTLTEREIDSPMAFGIESYRRILHIHWQQNITKLEIRQRLDIKKNVVQMIMKRKLNYSGIYYLQDTQQPVGEECDVRNYGWTKQERKTEQGVDGRHQRMVSRKIFFVDLDS